jgi:hypothetical protein
MAIKQYPYSGEFLARLVAARLASAFDFKSLNSAHVFQVSSAWVTAMFTLLVGTLTSPSAVALVGLTVGALLLPNIRFPTGFLVPATPLSLTCNRSMRPWQ